MSSAVAALSLRVRSKDPPQKLSHFGLPEPISTLPALGCMAYLKLKHPVK